MTTRTTTKVIVEITVNTDDKDQAVGEVQEFIAYALEVANDEETLLAHYSIHVK